MDLVRTDQRGYQSYLVRLWWDEARHGWHASAQSTTTEPPIHFASVEELFAYLVAQLAHDHGADGAVPDYVQA